MGILNNPMLETPLTEGPAVIMAQPSHNKPYRRRLIFTEKGEVVKPIDGNALSKYSMFITPKNCYVIESLPTQKSRLQTFVGRALGPRRLPVRTLSDAEVMSLLNQLSSEEFNFLSRRTQ